MQHSLVASRGRGQRFKEQQGLPTHREPGLRKAEVGPAAERNGAGEAVEVEGSRVLSVVAIGFAKMTAFRCNSQSNGSKAERPV